MVNDTIVNARNFSDRLCNEVILSILIILFTKKH